MSWGDIMKEIIESFFRERSLVNHQWHLTMTVHRLETILLDGKDCSKYQVGTDEEVEDEKGGLIKLDVIDQDTVIRVKNIQLGEPTIREADEGPPSWLWNADCAS